MEKEQEPNKYVPEFVDCRVTYVKVSFIQLFIFTHTDTHACTHTHVTLIKVM